MHDVVGKQRTLRVPHCTKLLPSGSDERERSLGSVQCASTRKRLMWGTDLENEAVRSEQALV